MIKDLASGAAVALAVFLAVFAYLYVFQDPMESVPLDGGWLGLLVILADGFFLSCLLSPKASIAERVLLTVGLGFGFTFALMIILGLFWEFSIITLLLTEGLALAVLGALAIYRGFRVKAVFLREMIRTNARITKLNIVTVLLLIITGIFVLVAFYDTLAFPAFEWDSLAYGVNYAKILFQHGNIPLIAGPSIGLEMSANYPPGVQLSAVLLYVFAGNANDFYYRLLSPIFSIATLIGVYHFAKLVNKSKTYSIYAIFGLSLVPFFWELFIEETYLMALTFMVTMAALFFYKAYISNGAEATKYEVIGALFAGFAALTSYMGLFGLGILLLYAVIKKIKIKHTVLLFAVAIVLIAPWYARNFVLLGNPIYPFFGIGNYLDPLLRSSTALHFQSYSLLPLNYLISVACKIAAVVLFVAVGYYTFSKRKNLLTSLWLYLLFVGFAVMAFHVAFPRYAMVAAPVLAVSGAVLVQVVSKKYESPRRTAAIIIALIIVSGTFMLPYINSIKPIAKPGEDQSLYVSRVFEEGDAWNWINENTPMNDRIATFDIKQYYVERDILSLDGNESAPLYTIKAINDSINFLMNHGVSYILSVPWASPGDNRLPPAYNWTVLTRYLGDPEYLPAVFVGEYGATVYHVGPAAQDLVNQAFTQKGLMPPLKHMTVNLTATNDTYPCVGKFYLPIPVDYRGKTIVASVNNSEPVRIELWTQAIPVDKLQNPSEKEFIWVAQSPFINASQQTSLAWHIDRAGYFTIRIVDKEKSLGTPFNLTVNLGFF
jgi:hypothetical protein